MIVDKAHRGSGCPSICEAPATGQGSLEWCRTEATGLGQTMLGRRKAYGGIVSTILKLQKSPAAPFPRRASSRQGVYETHVQCSVKSPSNAWPRTPPSSGPNTRSFGSLRRRRAQDALLVLLGALGQQLLQQAGGHAGAAGQQPWRWRASGTWPAPAPRAAAPPPAATDSRVGCLGVGGSHSGGLGERHDGARRRSSRHIYATRLRRGQGSSLLSTSLRSVP